MIGEGHPGTVSRRAVLRYLGTGAAAAACMLAAGCNETAIGTAQVTRPVGATQATEPSGPTSSRPPPTAARSNRTTVTAASWAPAAK
jgi:hypothetical protein